MTKQRYIDLYMGDGKTLEQRDRRLPEYEPFIGTDDPKNYIASKGLRNAVNVALTLGQPLLITGEPGTGKTRLGASTAWEMGLDLLEFHTKTTSTAADLFYQYDALRRFQDSQLKEQKAIEKYITCQALGTAIVLTTPADKRPEQVKRILPEDLRHKGPVRSVVLIDEIDKAPRDLPNDILNEVENMQFKIKETTWKPFIADQKFRPVLILTSNSEKNLPDAFLRRCVFFHIDFPDDNALKEIVIRRFKDKWDITPEFTDEFIENSINHFIGVRKLNLKKRPATAELLAWINIVKTLGIDMAAIREDQKEKLELSYSVLAKTREDLNSLKNNLTEMVKK
ncbi:MoxR family ATPase [Desulfobacterales bacterium HSG17]|nr:MoxR family ATPase [Desulfobacterales bacterium HSG17]